MLGTIVTRTTPRGAKRYDARWRDAAGVQRSKSFARRGDAEAFVREQVSERDLDDPTLPARFLGSRLIDGYIEHIEHRQRLGDLSPSTVAGYKSMLRIHIAPWLNDRRVDWLKPTDLQAWAHALAEGLDDGSLQPRTYNHILSTLSAMSSWAMKKRWLRKNLTEALTRAKAPRTERVVLEHEAQRTLLAAAPTPRLALALAVALYAGLRRGELCGLQWGDLTEDRLPRLHVQRVLVGTVVRAPKTATSRRVVDVPASLVARWTAERGAQAATGWVLPSESDPRKPMHPDRLQELVAPAFTAVGMTTQLHALRHTYATLLIAQGETAKYVSAQLGHASIQITLDVYGHLFQEDRSAAMARLEARLQLPPTPPPARGLRLVKR